LKAAVSTVEWGAPSRRLHSATLGKWVEAELATPEFWVQHLASEISTAVAPSDLGAVLLDVGEATPAIAPQHRLAAGSFAQALAGLFALGYPVQWQKGRQNRPARRVTLPTYAWQHQSYWIDAIDIASSRAPAAVAVNPLLGHRWRSPRVKAGVYESHFSPTAIPYLAEHRVHGAIVTPGALYLAQVSLQAADFLLRPTATDGSVQLSDIVFVSAMAIDPLHPRTAQTVFTPQENGVHGFEVISWTEASPDDVAVHVTGRCRVERVETTRVDLASLRQPLSPVTDIAGTHYATMDRMNVRLGPSFRWIAALHRAPGKSVLRLEAPAGLEACREWHPGLVDSFLQATVAALGLDGSRTLIPFRLDRVVFHRRPDGRALHASAQQIATADPSLARADVRLYDADGGLIAEALGFELRHLQPRDLESASATSTAPKFFETKFEPLATPSASPRGGAGAWLFLSDGDSITQALKRALQAGGSRVEEIASSRVADAEKRLATEAWAGVLYAWDFGTADAASLHWSELLACVRAAANRAGPPARWVFLTAAGDRSVAQSPLGGFVIGLAHEFADWRPVHLEIAPDDPAAEWIPWMLDATSGERRLVRREGAVCGERLVAKPVPTTTLSIRSDGTYLVTGAAGALGQAVAEWLVDRGARSLCLAGRRAADNDLKARIAEWQRRGATVSYTNADLADAASVHALVQAAGQGQPLRGVFHAAGALRDGLLRQADVAAFTSILGAKIGGAWELHRATRELPLDCFVLFSSIASLLGSPAQANYAAGNAFMDALAQQRQAAGLPGLSIQWGPWAEIGMTARLGARDRERLQQRGIIAMPPSDALHALERVLGARGCVGIFAWNRSTYAAALNGQASPFYARVFGAEGQSASVAPTTAPRAGRDYASLPLAARAEAIERLIREIVATLLGLEAYTAVDREKGLFDLGIDSLTAIDLKDRLEKALGHTLRTTIAFDYPTAAGMAAHLAESLFTAAAMPSGAAPKVGENTSPAAKQGANGDELSALSSSELEALLEQELKG
jgi:acyl transferase domain-containing protein/acyl carrier protein